MIRYLKFILIPTVFLSGLLAFKALAQERGEYPKGFEPLSHWDSTTRGLWDYFFLKEPLYSGALLAEDSLKRVNTTYEDFLDQKEFKEAWESDLNFKISKEFGTQVLKQRGVDPHWFKSALIYLKSTKGHNSRTYTQAEAQNEALKETQQTFGASITQSHLRMNQQMLQYYNRRVSYYENSDHPSQSHSDKNFKQKAIQLKGQLLKEGTEILKEWARLQLKIYPEIHPLNHRLYLNDRNGESFFLTPEMIEELWWSDKYPDRTVEYRGQYYTIYYYTREIGFKPLLFSTPFRNDLNKYVEYPAQKINELMIANFLTAHLAHLQEFILELNLTLGRAQSERDFFAAAELLASRYKKPGHKMLSRHIRVYELAYYLSAGTNKIFGASQYWEDRLKLADDLRLPNVNRSVGPYATQLSNINVEGINKTPSVTDPLTTSNTRGDVIEEYSIVFNNGKSQAPRQFILRQINELRDMKSVSIKDRVQNTDLVIRSINSRASLKGYILIPSPERFELTKVIITNPKTLKKYTLNENHFNLYKSKAGEGYILKLNSKTLIANSYFWEFRFEQKNETIPLLELKGVLPNKMDRIADKLKQDGFSELSNELYGLSDEARKQGSSINTEDLATKFAATGKYTYQPEDKTIPQGKTYGDLTAFLKEGVACYQCDSANKLLTQILSQSKSLLSTVRFRTTVVINRKGQQLRSPYHAVTEAYKQGFRSNIFDGTPRSKQNSEIPPLKPNVSKAEFYSTYGTGLKRRYNDLIDIMKLHRIRKPGAFLTEAVRTTTLIEHALKEGYFNTSQIDELKTLYPGSDSTPLFDLMNKRLREKLETLRYSSDEEQLKRDRRFIHPRNTLMTSPDLNQSLQSMIETQLSLLANPVSRAWLETKSRQALPFGVCATLFL